MDRYRSIAAPAQGLFKDKGSRFIALAYPVERPEEIREILQELRRTYHDARHVCHAWRLGHDGVQWHAADDGEPAGSAGRQILAEIDSHGLSDVLVAVVRYFGGIKLGVPGLIRAYRSSSADALSAAQVVEKVARRTFRLSCPYADMGKALKMVRTAGGVVLSQEADLECRIEAAIPLDAVEAFLSGFDRSGITYSVPPSPLSVGPS